MYSEVDNLTQVVEQLKKGDENAFATIYNQTYKYVYSRAKCMFSDEEEVQDLVQEVYLALYRNAANIQSSESIFGWLKTTTFYQGTKMLQKKRKEVLVSEEGEELFETIPDDEPQIEENYMNKEDVEVIRECINRLSDEQKTVLLAYYYDNLKVDEIADMLSISAGTIKSRLYLARKNLQVHIESEEKKRGYKLHSFGAVALALALRTFLQTNMEVAGSAEEAIFAKVCVQLNVGCTTEGMVGTVGGAKVAVKKATKQVAKKTTKGIAKKLVVIAVSTVSAVALIGGSIAVWSHVNQDEQKIVEEKSDIALMENDEEDKKDEEAIKSSRKWQEDYAKILLETYYMTEEAAQVYGEENPLGASLKNKWVFGVVDSNEDGILDLFIKENTPLSQSSHMVYVFTIGSNIQECYVEQGEYAEYEELSIDFYELAPENVSDVLNVNLRQKDISLLDFAAKFYENPNNNNVVAIYFNEDDDLDYVFRRDDETSIVYSCDEDYKEMSVKDEETQYTTYIEKESKLVEHAIATRKYARVKEIIDSKLVQTITFIEVTGRTGDPTIISYFINENSKQRELTKEEYEQKYNEICGSEKELYSDVQYKTFAELFSTVKITLKEEGD